MSYCCWPAHGAVAKWSKVLGLGSSHFDGMGLNTTWFQEYITFYTFGVGVASSIPTHYPVRVLARPPPPR